MPVEPGLAAEGDARLLRVVLDNLLGNAWKFTSKTANARIEFGAARGTDGAPNYFVRDNGAGFDMQYVNKLFGAFQRLHAMNEFPGTGVGLATVQRIVHRHGGAMRAEAEGPVPAPRSISHFRSPTQEADHDRKEQEDTAGGRQPRRRGADLARAAAITTS